MQSDAKSTDAPKKSKIFKKSSPKKSPNNSSTKTSSLKKLLVEKTVLKEYP